MVAAANKAKISYVNLLKEDLAIFRIVPENGIPDYLAGQFLTLGITVANEGYKTVKRAYSIASNPENKEYYEFVLRWVRKPLPGRVTTQMFYASEGDEVTVGNPTGNALTINQVRHDGTKDDRRIVCVGGGTGIAPFVSFAKHLHITGDKREVIVLHGASYQDELSYRTLFTDLETESLDRGKDKWNFRYRGCVSRPQEWFNRSWSGPTGRVENFLKPKVKGEMSPLEQLVGEKITTENTTFYICGWQGTIDGVMETLAPMGFRTFHDQREDGSFEVKYESYG